MCRTGYSIDHIPVAVASQGIICYLWVASELLKNGETNGQSSQTMWWQDGQTQQPRALWQGGGAATHRHGTRALALGSPPSCVTRARVVDNSDPLLVCALRVGVSGRTPAERPQTSGISCFASVSGGTSVISGNSDCRWPSALLCKDTTICSHGCRIRLRVGVSARSVVEWRCLYRGTHAVAVARAMCPRSAAAIPALG